LFDTASAFAYRAAEFQKAARTEAQCSEGVMRHRSESEPTK